MNHSWDFEMVSSLGCSWNRWIDGNKLDPRLKFLVVSALQYLLNRTTRPILSDLLKVADVQTHVCAKFLRTCANVYFWTQNRRKKTGIWKIDLHNLTKFLQFLHVYFGILSKFLCAKFLVQKFACAKKCTFRRSGFGLSPSTRGL